jgi:hypothetical protein
MRIPTISFNFVDLPNDFRLISSSVIALGKDFLNYENIFISPLSRFSIFWHHTSCGRFI